MGQVLLEPPSVFGWDWEKAWMSSTTMRSRAEFARDISTAQNGGKTSFDPGSLMDLTLTDAGQIVDAATDAPRHHRPDRRPPTATRSSTT